MLKRMVKELILIRKELQDIKLILKFHCLSNYRIKSERKNGKRIVNRYIIPDPLEDLRREESILQQYRKNGNYGPLEKGEKILDQTF